MEPVSTTLSSVVCNLETTPSESYQLTPSDPSFLLHDRQYQPLNDSESLGQLEAKLRTTGLHVPAHQKTLLQKDYHEMQMAKGNGNISMEDTGINVDRTKDYEKLLECGLEEKVAQKLDEIYSTGKLEHVDLDERALDALKDFPVDDALNVLTQFLDSNLEHVSNKSAYLCGVMKTYRQKSRVGQGSGSVVRRPDEDKVTFHEEIMCSDHIILCCGLYSKLLFDNPEDFMVIKEKFRVLISFIKSSNAIQFTGQEEDINKCLKHLFKIIEQLVEKFNITVPLYEKFYTFISGEGVVLVKKISVETDTDFKFPNESEKSYFVIFISGKLENVQAAKEKILKIQNELIKIVTINISVPQSFYVYIAGAGVQLLKTMSKLFGGVSIQIVEDNFSEYNVQIIGPKEDVKKACDVVNELSADFFMELVPINDQVGFLLDKNKEHIRRVQLLTGSFIFTTEENAILHVIGKPESVDKAKDLLRFITDVLFDGTEEMEAKVKKLTMKNNILLNVNKNLKERIMKLSKKSPGEIPITIHPPSKKFSALQVKNCKKTRSEMNKSDDHDVSILRQEVSDLKATIANLEQQIYVYKELVRDISLDNSCEEKTKKSEYPQILSMMTATAGVTPAVGTTSAVGSTGLGTGAASVGTTTVVGTTSAVGTTASVGTAGVGTAIGVTSAVGLTSTVGTSPAVGTAVLGMASSFPASLQASESVPPPAPPPEFPQILFMMTPTAGVTPAVGSTGLGTGAASVGTTTVVGTTPAVGTTASVGTAGVGTAIGVTSAVGFTSTVGTSPAVGTAVLGMASSFPASLQANVSVPPPHPLPEVKPPPPPPVDAKLLTVPPSTSGETVYSTETHQDPYRKPLEPGQNMQHMRNMTNMQGMQNMCGQNLMAMMPPYGVPFPPVNKPPPTQDDVSRLPPMSYDTSGYSAGQTNAYMLIPQPFVASGNINESKVQQLHGDVNACHRELIHASGDAEGIQAGALSKIPVIDKGTSVEDDLFCRTVYVKDLPKDFDHTFIPLFEAAFKKYGSCKLSWKNNNKFLHVTYDDGQCVELISESLHMSDNMEYSYHISAQDGTLIIVHLKLYYVKDTYYISENEDTVQCMKNCMFCSSVDKMASAEDLARLIECDYGVTVISLYKKLDCDMYPNGDNIVMFSNEKCINKVLLLKNSEYFESPVLIRSVKDSDMFCEYCHRTHFNRRFLKLLDPCAVPHYKATGSSSAVHQGKQTGAVKKKLSNYQEKVEMLSKEVNILKKVVSEKKNEQRQPVDLTYQGRQNLILGYIGPQSRGGGRGRGGRSRRNRGRPYGFVPLYGNWTDSYP